MIITNKFNLPQPVMTAILNDEYSRGAADISVTSLWKPARIVALEEQYSSEVSIDASKLTLSLFGRAMHEFLARRTIDVAAENRLYMQREGWIISGQIDRADLLHGGIEDWKFTTAYVVQKLSRFSEWEEQLNTYAHIARENGFTPKYLRVYAFVRDWSESEALRTPGYPQVPFIAIDLNLWTPEEAELKICARIREQQAARETLPLCTPEERWQRPDKYAVMKTGRKSAVKLFDFPTEADNFISQQRDSKQLYVEHRPGISMRCSRYCPVGASGLCSQWNNDPQRPQGELDAQLPEI